MKQTKPWRKFGCFSECSSRKSDEFTRVWRYFRFWYMMWLKPIKSTDRGVFICIQCPMLDCTAYVMSFKFEVFIINTIFYFHSNDALLYSGMYMWISYDWNNFLFCIFKFHHSYFDICNFSVVLFITCAIFLLLWHVLFNVLFMIYKDYFFYIYVISLISSLKIFPYM